MQKEEPADNGLAAVSAVIVNYNTGDLLVDCVREALAQARQVIVVDNGSADDSLELLESCCAGEPRLNIIRNGNNLGFAAACNVGIKQSTERNILFLNPDCVLGPSSLQRMARSLDANPDTGMVGGLLLDADGSEQSGGRRAVPTPWRSFVRAFGLTGLANRWPRLFYDFHLHKQPLPEHPVQVEAISGALMLVSKVAIEEVGAWDEGYFLHCEDLDWCMRFRQKGWNILFDPGAPSVHHRGACSQSRPIFVEWHKHKGMVRFYRKFFQHQYPGVLMWAVIVGVWVRFALVATLKAYKKMGKQVPYASQNIAMQQTFPAQSANVLEEDVERKQLRTVAVVGATSMVGQVLLPMLAQAGVHVIAYTRKPGATQVQVQNGIEWREMFTLLDDANEQSIQDWVWLAPIKALPQHLTHLQRAGARHVVAVSTTSRFTKKASSSPDERKFVEELISAEERLQAWAEENAATWAILRPTLIYGLGLDKNVGIIARFIRRFHFFPILGRASGMRQPIHARDVAAACKAALESSKAVNRAYNISGAEKLSYRTMVTRIFEALSIRPRFFSIPLWMFSAGIAVVRVLPPYRSWSSAMAERMNQDMLFDNADAARDFGFSPQAFRLDAADLPAIDFNK
jgi:GT2 family glycosyltransferase/uncharacterized protein YbjT (DUF2867 family)